MPLKRFKRRVFEVLELEEVEGWIDDAIDIFIVSLILISVASVILESEESIYSRYQSIFYYSELFIVAAFTIEYLLRLWTCVEDKRYSGPLMGRLKFVTSPLAVIDLLAILPFYLVLIPFDLRFLRLFRIVRLLKLSRYSKSFKTLGAVLKAKKEELLVTVFIVGVLLIIASSLMYYAERGTQPDVFSSIPEAMWWGVVTLTTVGYGDIYPVTPIGKILGAMIAFLGIGLFALPAGILGSGFVDEMQKKRQKKRVCPHCGDEIE